jgi:hypothetical protein
MFYTVLHTWITLLQTTENIEVPRHSAALYANWVWRWERFLLFTTFFRPREHWSFSALRSIVCKSGMKVQRNPRRIRDKGSWRAEWRTRRSISLGLFFAICQWHHQIRTPTLWRTAQLLLCERSWFSEVRVQIATSNFKQEGLVQSDVDTKRWTRWNTPKCTCFLLGGAEWCRREAMNASEHS